MIPAPPRAKLERCVTETHYNQRHRGIHRDLQPIRHNNLTWRHGEYILIEMSANSYSLSDLADATGIEARTIRSYTERGLLPGAEARGRAASYSKEHLSRLQVIRSLR